MKTVLFSGFAASALLIAISPAQASNSWSTMVGNTASDAMNMIATGAKPGKPNMGGGNWGGNKPPMMGGGNWGGKPPMHGGGWNGPKPGKPPMMGWHPRPGNHGIPKNDVYRRPYRGWTMPSYWVQPSFYVGNYYTYGLSAPSNGYYWSRYYDDAVLTDQRGYVQDYRSGVNWDAYGSSYSGAEYPPPSYGQGGYIQQPQYAPAVRVDDQAYNWDLDAPVGFAAPDGSTYRYEGDWVQGGFVDPAQNIYEGEWEGRVIRNGADAPPPPQHHAGAPYAPPQGYAPAPQNYAPAPVYERQAYQVPRGYEGYEKCLKSNGVTGGVIGAILGGFAGNQIAGRGDKLGGTLIGAGVGGLAGVAVEKATSKCKKYVPAYRDDVRYAPPPQYYPQPQPQYYPPTYQSGYYYYPQPQVTTVTVVPGSAVTTTTTTEEYIYETVSVPAKKRYVPAKKWKPKPKPRCTCR